MNIFKNLISFTVPLFVSILSLLGIDGLTPLPGTIHPNDADLVEPIKEQIKKFSSDEDFLTNNAAILGEIKNVAFGSFMFEVAGKIGPSISLKKGEKIIPFESGEQSCLKQAQENYQHASEKRECLQPTAKYFQNFECGIIHDT